jgi:hypothetical protein
MPLPDGVTYKVLGLITFLDLRQIAANLPTPWFGVTERINIYSYMLWMLVLAVLLLRSPNTFAREE